MPDLGKGDPAEIAGNEHKSDQSGENHQKCLEGVDVEQAFDAAHHSVECGNQSQDDYAPDHELELDAAEHYYADGYGCDEQARP